MAGVSDTEDPKRWAVRFIEQAKKDGKRIPDIASFLQLEAVRTFQNAKFFDRLTISDLNELSKLLTSTEVPHLNTPNTTPQSGPLDTADTGLPTPSSTEPNKSELESEHSAETGGTTGSDSFQDELIGDFNVKHTVSPATEADSV